MSEGVWRCGSCGETLEATFTECWSCGYVRGSGGDETPPPPDPADPMVCARCRIRLDFVGTKKFHEGSRAAPFFLGEVGELFVKREHFDVYVCSRCGRVELFLDGVGEEFRDG